MSIFSYVANMATSVFSIGNVIVIGIMVYMVAGIFSASLWLTNDHMAPVSNMAGTANPWP